MIPSKFTRMLTSFSMLFCISCSHHAVFTPDAKKIPASDSKKLPITVYLQTGDLTKMPYLEGATGESSYSLDLGNGIYEAIKMSLENKFQKVFSLKEVEAGQKADLNIIPAYSLKTTDYVTHTGKLTLSVFRSSKKEKSEIFASDLENFKGIIMNHKGTLFFTGFLFMLPSPWTFPWIAEDNAYQQLWQFETSIYKSLKKISKDIDNKKDILLELAALAKSEVSLKANSSRILAEERSGDLASKDGQQKKALTHYLAALNLTPRKTKLDDRLRRKIILFAQSMKVAPTLSEAGKRHAIRGQTFLKIAKNKDGFKKVLHEFEQTLQLVPWWGSGYYNLALVQEKVKDYDSALNNLDLYLLASPNARDREAIKRKIIEIGVMQEVANEKNTAAE